MQLDPTLYLRHLDGMDMDDADKLAFMEQLWAVLSSFVDRAWGESSEQILLGIRQADARRAVPLAGHDPLDSAHTISSTFNDAAAFDRR